VFGLEIAVIVLSLNPIIIDECRIDNTRSYVSADRPVVLAFTNRQATSADEIRFTVEYAGRTEHIIDRGTFSQNVRIDHAFSGFYNARYRGVPPTCMVDYVEFRDGSSWSATAASPGQSAGPPEQVAIRDPRG
jgi:K+-transporting ATPase KdpF subunit